MFRVARKPVLFEPENQQVQHINQTNVGVNLPGMAVAAVMATIVVTGCSVSQGMDSIETQDQLVTNSITKPVEAEGIGSEDAEIIKTVVSKSDENNLLAWQNPETGNKGTITAIDNFVGSHGQQCKKFQTTVDTFMGISLYNGETCELKKGFWVLSWFLRQEG